jgi:branched-chain amino acid transport system permease protein
VARSAGSLTPITPIPPTKPWHRTVRDRAAIVLVALAFIVGPSPAAAAVVPGECTTGPDVGCVGGTLRSADGAPLGGVELTVAGPAGESTIATAEDGRWSATVGAAGEYTVTLDVATLPAGETLRDPAANPRVVQVALGSTAPALFPMGAPEPSGDPPGPTEPTAAPEGIATEPGLEPSTSSGVTWARFGQQAVSGLVFGVLLALASVGLSLIFGTTGLSNFAHGEQVTLGGIMAYVFTQLAGLPLLAAGALAVLIGAASGWLQDAAIWRPLRKMRIGLTQQLIVTIGLAFTLQYAFQFFLGGSSLRIVRANPSLVHLGPLAISRQSLLSMVIAIAVLGAVGWALVGTRIGRATRAVSDNPALAAASGIAVDRIIRIVWTVGAALAALGGVLMGLYLNATAWNMGATLLLLMFAAVTLGGLGTAFGAVAGSLVIGLVVELSGLIVPLDMRYAGALVILILVLLLRPQGILGRAERVG